MEKIYVTEEGLEKMKTELQAMNERRMHVATAIEQARALGDLRENAEYHSAKEEQAMLHARIKDLEDKLTRAALITDEEIDTSKAYVGATVRVRNEKTKREMNYVLVSGVEADLASGKISVESPVGRALMGKGVGEIAVAKVPAGDLRLTLLDITY